MSELHANLYYAAALGDSLGVQFEFKHPKNIQWDYIEYPETIPYSYKTYKSVPLGYISDDFSRMLCVKNCIENDLDFPKELNLWMKGKYWTDEYVFDMGTQTAQSMRFYNDTGRFLMNEYSSGNGSLMSILPVALNFEYGQIKEQVKKYSFITHNSKECLLSCEFYCKLIQKLIEHDEEFEENFLDKQVLSKRIFRNCWNEVGKEMNWKPKPNKKPRGQGYVIDSLNLMYNAICSSWTFSSVLFNIICHGGDTDTNASIAAPVAALVYGMVPKEEWMQYVRVNRANKWYREAVDY